MEQAQLEKLKRRLGLDLQDDTEDKLLEDIFTDSQSHFMLITGASEVSPKYEFIIFDVADKRYNRKGSEGLASESVDGYSVTFKDIEDDFKAYFKFLERDFSLNDKLRERGRVLWY